MISENILWFKNPVKCSNSKFSSSLFCLFAFSSASMLPKEPINVATCIASVQWCAHRKNLYIGKQLHSYMLRNGFLSFSPASITSLINMYSKCNQISDSFYIFKTTAEMTNVYAYNTIMAGYVSNGYAQKALELYREMRIVGVFPDKYTFPCLLGGCSDSLEILEIRKMHGLVFKLRLDLDLYVGSALVKCYLKFHCMGDAEKVFNELLTRDVVLWNAMVNGYAQLGQFDEALKLFSRMLEEGIGVSMFTMTGVLSVLATIGDLENGRLVHGYVLKMGYDGGIAVSNALIDMYGKCRCMTDAMEIFRMMDKRDIFSWNSVMFALEQWGNHGRTINTFASMLGCGMQPDTITLKIVLSACTQMTALMHGRQIHRYMIISGMLKDEDIRVTNAIMDMYSKSGAMRDAYLAFKDANVVDITSWNIMITGYANHGYASEALNMFQLMCGTGSRPNEVTFVGVLTACSHAGFVCKGREVLGEMHSKFGLTPTVEHYTCVIDMLGRMGLLDEAYCLALSVPTETNVVVWRALLSACQLHDNANLADVVAEKVFELDPYNHSNYVLLSNVYVGSGRYDKVLEVRNTMRQQNLKKSPGCSWIELKSGVHKFVNGDQTHPGANSMYSGLNSLVAVLREESNMVEVSC